MPPAPPGAPPAGAGGGAGGGGAAVRRAAAGRAGAVGAAGCVGRGHVEPFVRGGLGGRGRVRECLLCNLVNVRGGVSDRALHVHATRVCIVQRTPRVGIHR
ncbi:MAG: hypothetical protein VXY93_20065, partial [Pseudomonadota bacterium]|nr:hypothetical protein [Pseudomonadota bacterium]